MSDASWHYGMCTAFRIFAVCGTLLAPPAAAHHETPTANTAAVTLVHVHGLTYKVMRRIAAPMVGGMITAPLLSMFVIPVAYLLLRRRRFTARNDASARLFNPAVFKGESK